MHATQYSGLFFIVATTTSPFSVVHSWATGHSLATDPNFRSTGIRLIIVGRSIQCAGEACFLRQSAIKIELSEFFFIHDELPNSVLLRMHVSVFRYWYTAWQLGFTDANSWNSNIKSLQIVVVQYFESFFLMRTRVMILIQFAWQPNCQSTTELEFGSEWITNLLNMTENVSKFSFFSFVLLSFVSDQVSGLVYSGLTQIQFNSVQMKNSILWQTFPGIYWLRVQS